MQADFVETGSINQCTVEAGTSDMVKNMLLKLNIQDTDYVTASDMFEYGAKMQVVKKVCSLLLEQNGSMIYTFIIIRLMKSMRRQK